MPTLEQRAEESPRAFKKRLKQRCEELDVSMAFSEYIEMQEIYLLKLERRVARLEETHNIDNSDILEII